MSAVMISLPLMLYRFQIELSDIDRGIYQTLDFRVVQHPSEITTYLLTRVLAYALSYHDNLQFSAEGLANPDSPALQATGPMGAIETWIEIGNPPARKLHKAAKLAQNVIVYTYKNADVLVKDISENNVHRANEIQIYSFKPQFLDELEKLLKKTNTWSLVHQQGQLDATCAEKSVQGEVLQTRV